MRRRVSIKNAILEVVESTSETYTKNMPTLMRWAKQSYIRINSYTASDPAVFLTTGEGTMAAIPSDAVMISLIFFGDITETLNPQLSAPMFVDILERFINYQLVGGGFVTRREVYYYSDGISIQSTGIPWQVQNDKLIFEKDVDGQTFTILYLKLPSDEVGYPLIEEEQVQAIGKFIEMKLAERENHHKFIAGKLKQADIIYARNLNNTYHNLVAKSRPTATPCENAIVRKLINNPWSGSSVI